MNVQTTVMADKIIIGNIMFSYCPMEADFSKLIPTPNGRISAKNFNPFGKISAGIVAPEKSNIGKYKRLVTMFIDFVVRHKLATVNPIENIDIIVKNHKPM